VAIALIDTDGVGFGVTAAGFVYNFPPGAPGAADLDVLCVNSDALIDTPAGWTPRRSEVGGEGAYIFSRKGGAGTSVTITTPSGAGPLNAALFWSRWSGTDVFDTATGAQINGVNGNVTPAVNTGVLAATGELVVAFGALHGIGGATQNTPVWSAGYTPAEFTIQGSGGSGCIAAGGYKLNAGTAAETPSVSWSGNGADERYMLVATFTAAVDTISPDGITLPIVLGEPALSDGSMTIIPDGVTVPILFGAPTISGATYVPPSVTVNLAMPGFATIVTGVGACIVDALDQTPAGAPCRQCLLLPTQQIPWDNCGCDSTCDGQVALAIRQVYGADKFPTPVTGVTWAKCTPRWWVARVVVSVTRCVPPMDDTGNPPSCAASLAAAIILENDRTAVRQAIACCLQGLHVDFPATLGAWLLEPSVTVGEQGGCAGSETEFLIGVQACPCPGG
jgi:hypothetical protein